MKHRTRFPWFAALLMALLIASQVWLVACIAELDMLPALYFHLILGALLLITLVTAALLFVRRQKAGLFRRIVSALLALAVSAGCLFGAWAVSKANRAISSVTNAPTVSAVVEIYVRSADPAQTLEDARNYTFAVTESYDWKNTEATLAAIRDVLGSPVTTRVYPTVFAMVDALYAGEVGALALNSAYLDILTELEAYADFPDNTRILYTHTVTETAAPKEPTAPATEATAPTAAPTGSDPTAPPENEPTERPQATAEDQPFLIYLSGSDTRSKTLAVSRSDVNIIAAVNPQTRQILLVNTPRDYYISNPAGGGSKDKLTHCGIYGIDCSVQALENLYGIEISYYAQINFSGFETLIDAVGGVTVYSEISFTSSHGGFPIYAGENHLNGYQALCYARERYALPGGDNDRGKNQMKIISAFIDTLSAGTILSNYAEILDSLEGMFVTSMPAEEISRLVKTQLSDMRAWEVLSYAVTGTGGSDITYSMPGIYAYVTYPDQASVELASQLIARILNGDTLTRDDLTLS